MSQPIHISCQFDSGNIEVINSESEDNIRLAIRNDNNSDFYQWFHFKVHGQSDQNYRFCIENASDAAYAAGWEDYQAVASYDRETWFRVDTDYRDGQLIIEHTHQHEVIYYAYFAPYSYERHLDLLQFCQSSPIAKLEHLGSTLDGRDMTLAIIGEPETAQNIVWMIARQHPGESMAEWLVEGFLQKLLDDSDPMARQLLSNTVFYVVPNMNPDGSVRGHLRTNAAGANLNREWLEPTMDRSPEVLLVRQKMQATGVDVFLDIHGDEAIPYNFLASCEGIPSYNDERAASQDKFRQAFLESSPDFQIKHGYPVAEPGQANLTMATTWVAETFGCVSFTLEMPFKDNLDLPDEVFGWSPERCMRLGEAICYPILKSIQ